MENRRTRVREGKLPGLSLQDCLDQRARLDQYSAQTARTRLWEWTTVISSRGTSSSTTSTTSRGKPLGGMWLLHISALTNNRMQRHRLGLCGAGSHPASRWASPLPVAVLVRFRPGRDCPEGPAIICLILCLPAVAGSVVHAALADGQRCGILHPLPGVALQ